MSSGSSKQQQQQNFTNIPPKEVQAMKDSANWNSLLLKHRKLRGRWIDPNTGIAFIDNDKQILTHALYSCNKKPKAT
jgi:hypothetical protein